MILPNIWKVIKAMFQTANQYHNSVPRMLHCSAILVVRRGPPPHCTKFVHLVQEITHGLRLVHGHLKPGTAGAGCRIRGIREWLGMVNGQLVTLWQHTKKTMEKHNFQWVNPRFLWPFSIAMFAYQRVLMIVNGSYWV